jgi:choline-glycine betaine transporter
LDRLEVTMPFLGQTVTHKPQPLHRSVSIVILLAIFSFFISTYDSSYLILTVPQGLCKEKRDRERAQLASKGGKRRSVLKLA